MAEDTDRGRQPRDRATVAAHGLGGVEGGGGGGGGGGNVETPTRGVMRRSSSLGRLGGNMRLPSLALVEIDIDGGSNHSFSNNDSRSRSCAGHGKDKDLAQCVRKDLTQCVEGQNLTQCVVENGVVNHLNNSNSSSQDVNSDLTFRRTSSFRRRPSLPLLKIISDFTEGSGSGSGGVGGGGNSSSNKGVSGSDDGVNKKDKDNTKTTTPSSSSSSTIETGRTRSWSLTSPRDIGFSICDVSVSSSPPSSDVAFPPSSLIDVKSVPSTLHSLSQSSPKHDGVSIGSTEVTMTSYPSHATTSNRIWSSGKETGTQLLRSSDHSPTSHSPTDIPGNEKHDKGLLTIPVSSGETKLSSMVHNSTDRTCSNSSNNNEPCFKGAPPVPAKPSKPYTRRSLHKTNNVRSTSLSSPPTTPDSISSSTPKLVHKYNTNSNKSPSPNFLHRSFDGKPPNPDKAMTSPRLTHDFAKRRASSLKRDFFSRTPSPLTTHKDTGRQSPMLNYNDVFGNSSDVTRGEMSLYDVGRTSSPVRFLQSNTSTNKRSSPSPMATRRAYPLLHRSTSATEFKLPDPSPRSRRGSQCSQSSEGARELLEAALEQMDDIINNSFDLSFDDDTSSVTSHQSGVMGRASRLPSHAPDRAAYVSSLMADLCHVLETTKNPDDMKKRLPRETLLAVRDWLIPDVEEIFSVVNVRSQHSEETVRRLEEDRHSLTLQVSVLTDQVEAQSEKIREMDSLMEEDKRRIMDANEILQQELLSRSHLESQQLELMSEVSGLKLRLASAEKDRREMDERCRAAQRQAAELEAKLVMKDAENSELRMRLNRNGTLPLDSENTEIEKLKRAVDTLMLANEEKERKLEDLRRLLRRYRRVEEILVQAQGRKAVEELLCNIEDGDTSSNSSSTTPSASGSNQLTVEDNRLDGRPYISSPSATSTPVHHGSNDASRLNASFHGSTNGSTPPVLSMGGNSRQAMGLARSNSCENLVPGKAPPGKGDHHHNTLGGRGGGGGSLISPGYAHSEVVTDDEDGLQHYGPGQGESKKRRGLRRLFGRLKRSSSQDLEGSRDRRGDGSNQAGDFKRGGVRATATGRLAWNRDVKGRISSPDIPFARWDTDRITAWLNDIGLNMYLVDCKRWVRNGEQLMKCSQNDLEKELGMKNSLHRKKLTLAMQAVSNTRPDLLEELDHNFVARWLDDIGLPQYKDSFYDARVDARMLNSLTVEDLFNLKVSSEVHHVSIRRGIQALRLNNFNPNALRRRPVPEEQQKQMESMPGEVMLWTNHRVMEWLRTIDLSEYAPNLRGSGVHGALMVLEPRFNAELFAVLLSIPASKTLLRRHLNSHFVGLIGSETQQRKREVESQSGFVPLLHNNKIKKGKFGLFHHKRTRSEPEMDSLICPPDINGHQHHNNGKLPSEKTTKEIGAFSQEINSLTNMLSHERFMESGGGKTSNV